MPDGLCRSQIYSRVERWRILPFGNRRGNCLPPNLYKTVGTSPTKGNQGASRKVVKGMWRKVLNSRKTKKKKTNAFYSLTADLFFHLYLGLYNLDAIVIKFYCDHVTLMPQIF